MRVKIMASGKNNKNGKKRTVETEKDELDYIARMSEEMARMAAHCDRKFIAYLLSMVALAAREEHMKQPCANDGKTPEARNA